MPVLGAGELFERMLSNCICLTVTFLRNHHRNLGRLFTLEPLKTPRTGLVYIRSGSIYRRQADEKSVTSTVVNIVVVKCAQLAITKLIYFTVRQSAKCILGCIHA